MFLLDSVQKKKRLNQCRATHGKADTGNRYPISDINVTYMLASYKQAR